MLVAKTSKLDPKHTKHFNETIINNYFDQQEELDRQYNGIPPEHQWSMDENGIQWEGAGRNVARSFIISDCRSINIVFKVTISNL